MKTEYKKVSELLALENEEVLKEFEMVELKGGSNNSLKSTNISCTNNNCDCVPSNKGDCYCTPVGQSCVPPITLTYCTIFNCSIEEC